MALIHHYKLENDLTDSIGGLTATCTTDVSYDQAKIRNGAILQSHQIVLPNFSFSPTDDFSYSMWFKLSNLTTAAQTLLCNRVKTGTGIAVFIIGKKLRFDTENQTVYSTELQPNIMYNATIVRRGNTKRVYLNGIEEVPSTGTNNITAPNIAVGTYTTIGASYTPITNFLTGIIDDVRIYDHALSEREVRDLNLGLVAHFKFDNDLYDCAQYTVGNNPSSSDIEYDVGMFGNGAKFKTDGGVTNKKMLIDPIPLVNTTSSFWYKRNDVATAGYETVIGSDGNYHPVIFTSGVKEFTSWMTPITRSGYMAPNDDKFHHYVIQYPEAGGILFYVDGVLIKEVTTSITQLHTATINCIGSAFGYAYPTSNVDDVRIYSTILTPGTIKELYHQRSSIDSNRALITNIIQETGIRQNIKNCNWTNWQPDTTGSVPGFTPNGTTAENRRVIADNPWGKKTIVWEGQPAEGASDNSDGGWNTSFVSIDETKMYRFSVWMRRVVTGNGSSYLGCNATPTVINRSTGAVDGNPYFLVLGSTVNEVSSNEWFLWVGHVWPSKSGTGLRHVDSGVYNISGTKTRNISTDFVWAEGTTTARHRSYLYYSSNLTTVQQFCYPRMDVCDGTEPSIRELVAGFDSINEDIFRAYGGEIPPTSITNGVSSNFSEVGITDGLTAWYPLKNDALDYVGQYNPTSVGATQTVDGYKFDSVASRIIIPTEVGYQTSVTASVWFKSLGAPGGGYHTILGGNELEISVSADGSVRGGVKTTTTRKFVDCASDTSLDGNWHHIAVSFNEVGGILSVYLDGTLLGNFVGLNPLVPSVSGRSIGTHGSSVAYWTNGIIQDVRFYDRALSDDEISILHNVTTPTNGNSLSIFDNVIHTRQLCEV